MYQIKYLIKRDQISFFGLKYHRYSWKTQGFCKDITNDKVTEPLTISTENFAFNEWSFRGTQTAQILCTETPNALSCLVFFDGIPSTLEYSLYFSLPMKQVLSSIVAVSPITFFLLFDYWDICHCISSFPWTQLHTRSLIRDMLHKLEAQVNLRTSVKFPLLLISTLILLLPWANSG